MPTRLLFPRISAATARDGYRFFVRVWDAVPPPQEKPSLALPAARVFFLHGIVSHGGWYHPTCARVAAAGFEVHFLDRRGSGLNAAGRGAVDSCDTWIRDVADYIEAASHDQRPAILAGISWGGKLALAVAKHRPDLLAGLALICPGIFSQYGTGWLQRAGVVLANLTPARNWRTKIPLQDARLFTDEPRWQRYIQRDPLVLRHLTIRAARANLELSRYVEDAATSIRMPILLMLAGRDRIIDNAQTRLFFEGLASRQKRLLHYPQAAHTFEFGQDRDCSARDFADWCGCITGGNSRRGSDQEIAADAKKPVEWVS